MKNTFEEFYSKAFLAEGVATLRMQSEVFNKVSKEKKYSLRSHLFISEFDALKASFLHSGESINNSNDSRMSYVQPGDNVIHIVISMATVKVGGNIWETEKWQSTMITPL